MTKQNPDKSTNFTYSAFISYRRLDFDTKWAKWLMEKLETYRTPKESVNDGVPPNVRKLFRDDDEIPASADLSNQLEENLKSSEFLIVVCSPDTPKSDYVSQEIAFFKSLGRGDKIIPFLIAGEPEESYPPELFYISKTHISENTEIETLISEINPIAADVRPRTDEKPKITKQRALLRIAAALLHCRYDDLYQRELKRQRRKQRILYTGISSFLILLIWGTAYWWDYTRIKTRYFYAYTTQYGIPKGLGEISKQHAEKMYLAYALSYQRRQLIKMERIKGARNAVVFENGYETDTWLTNAAKLYFDYNNQGVMTTVTLRDNLNILIGKLTYNYNISNNKITGATVSFEKKDKNGVSRAFDNSQSLDLRINSNFNKTEVTKHTIRFNENGYVTQIEFRNFYGMLTPDQQNSFGRKYTLDSFGNIHKIEFLENLNYERLVTKTLMNGVHEIQLRYNSNFQLIKLSSHSEDGSLINSEGYASKVIKYNPIGNPIETTYFDQYNFKTNNYKGYATAKNYFDDNGNVVKESFYNEKGKPTFDTKGISSLEFRFNMHGLIVEVNNYDNDGKLIANRDGIAKSHFSYNTKDQLVEIDNFGVNGKPVISNRFRCAKIKSQYDDDGNEVESSCYGLEGKLTLGVHGTAKQIRKFDGMGNVIEVASFGDNNKPVLNDLGCAKIQVSYDLKGNPTKYSYFGVDGKLKRASIGYAKGTTHHVNSEGKLIKVGVAKFTIKYDASGNEIEYAYFDEFNNLILDKTGSARTTKKYDSKGNDIEQNYFGTDGQPTLNYAGFAKLTSKYDRYGNHIEESYFDLDNKLVLSVDGYAKSTQKYNVNRQITEKRYFGVEDKPMNTRAGYSQEKITFDQYGREIEASYHGLDGKRIMTVYGYARVVSNYNRQGRLIERAYLGPDDKPSLNKYGFAKNTIKYNNQNRIIEVAYFGLNGQLTNINSGYSKIRIEYYRKDNREMSKYTYYDAAGKETGIVSDNFDAFDID